MPAVCKLMLSQSHNLKVTILAHKVIGYETNPKTSFDGKKGKKGLHTENRNFFFLFYAQPAHSADTDSVLLQ